MGGRGHCPPPLLSLPTAQIDHFMNASVITTYSVFFISANNSKRCYHSYDKKCHTDYDVSYEVRYEKGPSINDVVSIGAQGTPYNKNVDKGRGEGVKKIERTSFINGPKKECQTTHHPECKKIPHTIYVEKCDVNTEQKCETVYESVQEENCNTVYDTKCHTSYDAPLYRNSKVNLHPFKSHV